MIHRLYVHNFRGLDNFSLDLAGRPSTLLIGRNGAGKSSIRQCMEVLQAIGRRQTVQLRKLITASAFTQRRTDVPMRFEVELSSAGRQFVYAIAFDWPENFKAARIVEESLMSGGEAIFSRKFSDVRLGQGQTFGLDWHTAALPVVNLRPDNSGLEAVRTFLSHMILVAPVPALMEGFSDEPSPEMDLYAQNLASCVTALVRSKPAAYQTFDAYVRAVLPDFAEILFDPRGESGYGLMVRFEKGGSSFQVDFKDLSDGEKCFFLSAYIVALNVADRSVFCMWDEPDNHLALPEVSQFVTRLRKMTSKGGQFIATSHHPEAIRRFSDDSTFVLTRAGHLAPSIVRPLDELPHDGDLVGALLRDEIIGTQTP